MAGSNALTTFSSFTNRASNLPCAPYAPAHDSENNPYDSAGNQLCDTDQDNGVRTYSFDAESRIGSISIQGSSSPFVSYLYGANGLRARKSSADGTFTEYVYFAGVPVAEKDQTGTWTDYVYANGKKIARIGSTLNELQMSGHHSVAGCATTFIQSGLGGYQYAIQPGDTFFFDQKSSSSTGGLELIPFNSGVSFYTGSDTGGTWAHRSFDLTPIAGQTINGFWPVVTSAAAGSWTQGLANLSIVSTSGIVTPIYWGQSITINNFSESCGAPASSFAQGPFAPDSSAPNLSTTYLLADHLGTAQLEFAPGGWPTWHGQFAPFGQELASEAPYGTPVGASFLGASLSNNRYKFTGKERDAESGLDYFGARYYGSNMGRFMTPDWSANAQPVPYAKMENPQSLNLYSYVGNNPETNEDPDGHDWLMRYLMGAQTSIENENFEEQQALQRSSQEAQKVAAAQQQNSTQTATVIVTSDTALGKEFGSHAAIWLDNGPDGAALYDPGGSYHQDTRGSDGVLTQQDDHASLQDYIKYQENAGSKVSTAQIKLSAQDEATIYQHARDNGERRGLHCAADVSRAVSGVGPFKSLKEVFLPGTLLKEARSIAASQ